MRRLTRIALFGWMHYFRAWFPQQRPINSNKHFITPLSLSLSFQILGRPDNQFYGWRILFAIPLLFSVMQLAVLPWCPRSPRFLYLKKKDREGALRGGGGHEMSCDCHVTVLSSIALKRLRHTLADVREDERAIKVQTSCSITYNSTCIHVLSVGWKSEN